MDTNLSSTTQTSMKTGVPDYSIPRKTIDEATNEGENYFYNDKWSEYLGYYQQIPELKKSVDALATWTTGKGWTTDAEMQVILEHITGWGEDSFDSIMQNMIIVKKVNRDSYSEIIRDDETGTLINLKPINPLNIRHVLDDRGIIIRYDVWQGGKWKEMKLSQIFHLCNDRIANEAHGTSVIEACKWVINARNEAMADWRRILHRSTIRVMYIDADDTSRLSIIKTQYSDAIKNGELMLIPAKKGEAEFADLIAPPSATFLEWIRYLENFFYQAVGIPKIILGGSQEFTEASSKVGYLTFEQVYMAEQRLLEQDIWNQLGIRIKFGRPVSLKEDILTSEAANTGQVGFQPNEMQTQMGRTE